MFVATAPRAAEPLLYFEPLGILRRDCWITDFVKVFLFKEGHRAKYVRLGSAPPTGYERECFAKLAVKSIGWIEKELQVAQPRLVITLGAEIAGLLRGVSSTHGTSCWARIFRRCASARSTFRLSTSCIPAF
jgi:hypothetical protein